jgi:hypothetical protein
MRQAREAPLQCRERASGPLRAFEAQPVLFVERQTPVIIGSTHSNDRELTLFFLRLEDSSAKD